MDWTEFAVVVGCGLVGFIIVNAVIEARRSKERSQGGAHDSAETRHKGDPNDSSQKGNDAQPDGSRRSWWQVLNVERNATADQIKEAFRREIAKYHPDKVASLGAELRELAERKAKEVNGAYTGAKEQLRF